MRLLLVRLSALGDIVHTWPLAHALRQADPGLHLSWIVEESFRTLVEDHPAVDAVFSVSTRQWRAAPFKQRTRAEIGRLKTALHELGPDIVLDSQGTLKSAWISRWAPTGERVGLCRPWRKELLAGLVCNRCLPGSLKGHVVSTNLEMVRVLGPDHTPPELIPDGRWFLEKASKNNTAFTLPSVPFGIILPGAGGKGKTLCTETLAQVAEGMAGRSLLPIVAWGPGEENLARAVCEESCGEMAPRTNLEELALLIGNAHVVIGADTGPIHLATSMGVPVIAIYIVTDPRRNGPLGPTVKLINAVATEHEIQPASSRAHNRYIPQTREILEKLDELLHERHVSGTIPKEMKQ